MRTKDGAEPVGSTPDEFAAYYLGGNAVATGQALPLRRTLLQGEAVGRPSVLGLEVDAAGAIRVSGEVIELGRGTLDL